MKKVPPHCKFFVVGREPQLWQKHFWLIDCSSPCLKVIHGHWTNVRRMQFSPSFKVTVPCDLDAKKLCKARAILTPQIFWLTRFKDKGIECLNIISGQSLVTQCIFGRKQTHKRWFKIFSAVFQIIIIKRRGCFSSNLITFALKRVSMTSLAPPSSESVLQRRHLEIFYTFLRIELRRQKLAAPSEVRKSVSYFKAFWKFGNKKCLGPFVIFAIHVKLMEPDLLPGSELGSQRWVMQQIWFRPVDAGRPEESLTCCRRLYKSRSKMLIGINWQK